MAQDIATDVLVVDNASEKTPRSASRRWVSACPWSACRATSAWLAAATSPAARSRATGASPIFDNDAEAAPDMVRRLMEEGDAAERIGMVGPKIYRLDQPDVIARRLDLVEVDVPAPRPGGTDRSGARRALAPPLPRHPPRPRPARRRPVRHARDVDQIGCVQLIRTDTLRDVGLLDEDFSPATRGHRPLRAALGRGWRIRYAPRANAGTAS